MEYEHSTIVDPITYDDFGLCGGIPLRTSNHGHLADKGCQRARNDWNRHVGENSVQGCMCPRFNMTSVTIPECLPERLEIIAYVNEFAFLQDGISILARYSAISTNSTQM